MLRTQKDDPDFKIQDFDLPNAIESLKKLKTKHKLYLISYSGAKRAIETTKYINNTLPNLFEKTFFVTENKYKHNICKACHIDVMIDERIDVLNMIDLPIHKIHFIGDPLYKFGPTSPDWKGYVAKDWEEVLQIIDRLSVIEVDDISQYCHPKYE